MLIIIGFINNLHGEKRFLQVLPIFHSNLHKSTAVEDKAYSHWVFSLPKCCFCFR